MRERPALPEMKPSPTTHAPHQVGPGQHLDPDHPHNLGRVVQP